MFFCYKAGSFLVLRPLPKFTEHACYWLSPVLLALFHQLTAIHEFHKFTWHLLATGSRFTDHSLHGRAVIDQEQHNRHLSCLGICLNSVFTFGMLDGKLWWHIHKVSSLDTLNDLEGTTVLANPHTLHTCLIKVFRTQSRHRAELVLITEVHISWQEVIRILR